LGAFRITTGVRYYSYDGDAHEIEGGGLISGPAAPFVFVLPNGNSGANPKLNLSYEPSRDVTVYAQASRGFRPGGVNTPPPNTCPSNPLQYGPDDVWSYEIGEKLRFLDNRLVINSSAYYEDWRGIQQLVTEVCGATYTANAGTAHIYGGELEATWAMTPELTFSTAAGYTNARMASVEAGTGFTVGERVQSVPDWTDTSTIAYTRSLSGDWDLTLRATDVYVGTSTDLSFQLNRLPVRNIVNLRAGLIGKRHLSVFLFADNVTDKRADLGDPEEIFTFVPALNRETTNPPRTVGAEVTYAISGK
jgi:outer membrane receptor protein involved in Fe transport